MISSSANRTFNSLRIAVVSFVGRMWRAAGPCGSKSASVISARTDFPRGSAAAYRGRLDHEALVATLCRRTIRIGQQRDPYGPRRPGGPCLELDTYGPAASHDRLSAARRASGNRGRSIAAKTAAARIMHQPRQNRQHEKM